YYAMDLPDVRSATATTRRPSITFVSAEGEAFAAYGDIFGEALDLKEMAPALPAAVMATEDRHFYHHFGIDLIGLARAVWVNFRAGHVVQGGSTITQQLAKNLFLTPERNLKRKVQEVLMALWLEHTFSKDQILAIYLNRVYLGSGTYGVDAAARRYFDKSARDLTLYESAMLAGALKAPSKYNPINSPKLAHGRTTQVLINMVNAGVVKEDEARKATEQGVGRPWKLAPSGRYFADWLYDQVSDYAGTADRDIVVATTLTLALQRKAEAELEAVLAAQGQDKDMSQGAILVMSPDGAVRTMVGGRGYGDSQFNRVTRGLRQPGSSFKPFVYLAGLEAGLSPDDVMEDAPLTLGNWSPKNYDGKFHGPMTLRQALAKSTNTIAVRVSERAGRKKVIAMARRLGITTKLPNDSSIALGTGEVSLLELTGAYAAMANGGQGAWPYGIAEIKDKRDGAVIYKRAGGGPGRVLSPAVTRNIQTLMSAVME
ncbi:MAG: transglycosylase domain-containing protein, partial [Rhodospirillales bacterium]|nr:transglycosylase domain-containing protein [Rhodospirillales bacterium]